MSSEQQAELLATLQDVQRELRQLLVDSTDSSQPVALDQPIGRLSRMDALQQQAMAKANRSGHEQRLQLIDAALLAIRQDRYGTCRRCEEPIGYPRLRVRPETPFCLACQDQMEGGR